MLLLKVSLSLLVVSHCYAYKVLIYSPQIGHSHVSFFAHIADTLVQAGHHVVLYVPAYYEGVTTTGAGGLARILQWPLPRSLPFSNDHILSDAWTDFGGGLKQQYKMFMETAANIRAHCEMQMADEALMEKLREEHFDVGISETWNVCGFVIFDRIGIRTNIGAFATPLIDVISGNLGAISNPSYIPGTFSQYSDVMSYTERVQNTISYAITWFIHDVFYQPIYGSIGTDPQFPEKAIRSLSFAFVNADEFVEYPRPIGHKIVYIGGIAVKKPEALNEEYNRVMESAKGEVVLVSFGSVAKSTRMPPHIRDAFIGMYTLLPEVTFIWKYEIDDDVAANLSNVIKKKWVPQNDIFAHPKLRAFVTHGGLNSITESTHAGVPMICVPLFGDQMRNSKMAENRHVAVVVDKSTISAELLADAVRTVLYNETYGESARRLARMINNKPIPPRERVVRYTEFAAEFGPFANLNSASLELNFFQRHLIDILVPGFLILLLLSTLIFYGSLCAVRHMWGLCYAAKFKKD